MIRKNGDTVTATTYSADTKLADGEKPKCFLSVWNHDGIKDFPKQI